MRLCGLTHIVPIENFQQKTIWFNPYCPYWTLWTKDNMVQPILSFSKVLSKRQYGSANNSPLRRFWPKANMVQPILSLLNIFNKRQYGSIHIILIENFEQKTIWFNPYCLFWKFCLKDNMVQPIEPFKKILTKRQYGSTHIVF